MQPPRSGLDRSIRWAESSVHRQWLTRRLEGLLAFYRSSSLAGGGFALLDGQGKTMPDHTPKLYLAARMTHGAAIGLVVGLPGSAELLDHGMESLLGPFADEANGGWSSEFGSAGSGPYSGKATYEHVQVMLGAASAVAAGHSRGEELLSQAIEVFNEHLWQEEEGALAESWNSDWTNGEAYRGANANMHGVEAMLAVGDVTADEVWHQRALRVAERLINTNARAKGWLIPEHFDVNWQELPDYNSEEPDHPFRPYGATYGHSLEWARFLVGLHASPFLGDHPWLLEAAAGLTTRALDSWASDGREGLVYTVDWDGTPVSTIRLHWPICEGIQACSVLSQVTEDPTWESWYRKLWDHATKYFVEDNGVWINEIDAHGSEAGTLWPGRPDIYHSLGTYVVPQVQPSPFVTLAAARGF